MQAISNIRLPLAKAVRHVRLDLLDTHPILHGVSFIGASALELLLVLFLVPDAAVLEFFQLDGDTIIFSVVAGILPFLIDQMLEDVALL